MSAMDEIMPQIPRRTRSLDSASRSAMVDDFTMCEKGNALPTIVLDSRVKLIVKGNDHFAAEESAQLSLLRK